MATEKDAAQTHWVLTNVRLTVAEHRAAKRRALELGVPLAELLRRGLLQALGGGTGQEAREEPSAFRTQPPGERWQRPDACPAAVGPGQAPMGASDRQDRLERLGRTAGALRGYDMWMDELDGLRGQPPRDLAWGQGRMKGDRAGAPLGREGD